MNATFLFPKSFYDKNDKFILPISRRNEVINFVKSGLKDLSVSRTSFTWGIRTPNNSKHIIYVWLDALTNYLSALNYPDTKDSLYRDFWPASLHVIGKDILRFHAIYWPAFLLAANIDPPRRVFSHGWILSGDEKMSKSKGNILNPVEIINIYGIDQLRYYLMKEVSHGADGNITLKNLENCITIDLANKESGSYLHQFKWLEDNQIGDLDERWNWLEGWTSNHNSKKPFAVHYTRGGPWFNEWKDVEYADLWNDEKNKYLEKKFNF